MLLFADGFDAMAAIEDTLIKWTLYNTTSSPWSYLPAGGLNGGGALFCNQDDRRLLKQFRDDGTAPQPVFRMSMWIKSSAPASAVDTFLIMGGGAATGAHYARYNTDGTLSFSIAEGGSIFYAYSTTTIICDNSWHHIQIGIKTGTASDGEIKVWIDGISEISATGINTYADNDINRAVLRFETVTIYANDIDATFDDIIIWDDDVGDNFTGELAAGQNMPVIETVYAQGAGSSADFTPVGEASNYLCVDDTGGHDGLSTYVHAQTPGDKDLYTGGTLDPATTDILGVVVNAVSNTDAGASVDIRPLLKSGTTEAAGDVKTVVSDAWRAKQASYGIDPDTGLTWTKTGVESIEFGLEIA